MHRVSRRRPIGLVRAWCAFVLLLGVLVPGAGVSPAAAQQSPSNPPPPSRPTGPNVDPGLVRQLGQDTGGGARIEYHRETGKARFIGASLAHPIPRSARLAANASPEVAARSFMASYGPLFGTQDESRDLALKRVKADTGGRSIVRFAQQYSGIPVFAGEVIVHLDKGQNVQAAIGELLPDIAVDTTPQVSTAEAKATARAVVARDEQVNEAQLQAGEPELQIYNRVLIGDPGPNITQLVWRVEVSAGPREPIRYLVLVDAHGGGIALRFNQVPDAKNRLTYNMNHSTTSGTLVCDESNPTCSGGDADAVAAHKYAGDTYDFYLSRHGRDSIDGAGMTIRSFVHYGTNVQNAFWDGFEMVYGDGFAAADDVAGHELTHGVTQYESGLFYFRQAGAINESLSDLWGEWIDQVNGSGTDTPGVKWLLGEDVPVLGAIRNMANPPAFNDPDRMTSSNYYGSSLDNGGVHHNSGVNNKAAFLMTDGGTFNGKTVTGLGIDKTAKLYYEAQTNLLTPGSDYGDLYTALQQACSTLTSTGVMTVADCQQVQNAIDAVEMNLAPVVAGAAPPNPPFCPTGQSPTDLFFDDLENVTTTTSNFSHTFISGGDS
ncbi:MAG: M4 family metallopeptidase [Chloroflexota bacterium]